MKKFILVIVVMTTCFARVSASDLTYGNETIQLSDSVKPGESFYNYVNENWHKTNSTPKGYPLNSSFVEAHLKTQQQLKTLISELSHQKSSELSVDQSNVIHLYQSYMNTKQIESKGMTPIAGYLKQIEAVKTKAQMTQLISIPVYQSIVGVGIDIDVNNPNQYAITLSQGGLGMGDRINYIDDRPQIARLRAEYLNYVTTILQRIGFKDAEKRAQQVVDFEIELAKVHWSAEQVRDVEKMNHPMTITELKQYAPDLDWELFFQQQQPKQPLLDQQGDALASYSIDREKLDNIIVSTDTAVRDTAKLYATVTLSTLKDYQAFHLINSFAQYLPKEIADLNFHFYSVVMRGVQDQHPREQRAVDLLNRQFGDTFGKLYVERFFLQSSKMQVKQIIDYLIDSYGERFKHNEWMDEPTRQQALDKLAKFDVKIGYPDQWHDSSRLQLKADDLIGNIIQIQHWKFKDFLNRLGEPVRKWEWDMLAQEVNAYYMPTTNEITFPAAILQAPFFNPDADPAFNFGAIGAVIGHEIGHGFDDQGRLFDGTGKVRDWWSSKAGKQYRERTTKLIKQYSKYKVGDLKVNSQLTLGENIGDLGGLSIALQSYKVFAKKQYPNGKAPIIDGLTGEQRLFIAWAYLWKEQMTPEFERQKVLTDPHSPGRFRVDGIVRNIDEWYDTFNVGKDDPLYLPIQDRVTIW